MYRYKQIYKIMTDSEDLFHVYDGMTGNWNEDKDEFIKQHQALESISNSITTTDEEYID